MESKVVGLTRTLVGVRTALAGLSCESISLLENGPPQASRFMSSVDRLCKVRDQWTRRHEGETKGNKG